ncbi:MAG: sigma-70 family RNA polymerase sigma factor, partial [Gammaproteobacteria bacterium]|nr:sigma-70 family RNA polymerase sigma factor [Gammaproteobacteria bacterium]
GIMNQTRTIRLPIHVIKEINSYLRSARKLAQQLDREPELDEIAADMGCTVENVRRLFGLNERTTSANIPVSRDSERTVLECIPDDDCVGPEQDAQTEKMTQVLEVWLEKLNDKQLAVVERRFGLHGFEKLTLEQVGAEIGVTRERVRQIQMDALNRLRGFMESQGLDNESVFD